MFSINIKKEIVSSFSLTPAEEMLCHEEVVKDRYDSLLKYLRSLKPYAILPSVIMCNKTNVIIDGHHRYHSLIDLGMNKIPTTKINYSDSSIIADLDNEISKEEIIYAGINKQLLKPKSSFHHILDVNDKPSPIILLSTICKLDF
tara:strand:+ start:218 stop:652 length:435 start_codon:yes stop_codon:yes gene_type:complete